MNPYEVLGVPPEATWSEIEDAYRQQAMRLHPDAGGDAASYQRLNDAYEEIVLTRRQAPAGGTSEVSRGATLSPHKAAEEVGAHSDAHETTTIPRAAMVIAGVVLGAGVGCAFGYFADLNLVVTGVIGAVVGGIVARFSDNRAN